MSLTFNVYQSRGGSGPSLDVETIIAFLRVAEQQPDAVKSINCTVTVDVETVDPVPFVDAVNRTRRSRNDGEGNE